MRRDRKTSLLRDNVSRNRRGIQDNERLRERFPGVEKRRITLATKRSHIKLKRIDKVLTMLDMLLKYLEHHTYWIERKTCSGNKPLIRGRSMGERARQCCHWWISQARQELSLDRERCANEIVIGRHLESCAGPIEGWIAYRRLTTTCASAYYHGRVDVNCITVPGRAIWDSIATELREMLGISYRDCLQAKHREQTKSA